MTFLVGLTGGIGSGKTAVSDYFASLGAHIVDTDIIARDVVRPGEPALGEIKTYFGDRVISASGNLDRDALRDIAFKDPAARQKLESITHPYIRKRTFLLAGQSGFHYCIIVVPLLVESEYKRHVDRVLVVVADRKTRIERVQSRSGLSSDEVEAIMDSQVTDRKRLAIADDVLVNDSDLASLQEKIEDLHQLYMGLAGSGAAVS